MDKRKTGQVSIEFLVVMGIILTVLIILGFMVYRTYVKSSDLKVYIYGARLGNHITDGINTINAIGDGHSTVIRVPKALYGDRRYTVSFFENESTVFVEGGTFTIGNSLTYSSPISTGQVHCLLHECYYTCNRTSTEECLNVSEQMDVRLTKYSGKIYLTPMSNVMQDGVGSYLAPYSAEGDPDPYNPPDFVREGGEEWNVMYVHRNLEDDSLSLVFSVNLTESLTAKMNFSEMLGDVVDTESNEPEEMVLEFLPPADWRRDPLGGIDGGYIKFKEGFRMCVTPLAVPSDWMVLSSDGRHIPLDNTKDVCVTYP
ncbi:MAG: hypothetical protein V1744_04855 [Candidatus Altiarchaeota archaeon]